MVGGKPDAADGCAATLWWATTLLRSGDDDDDDDDDDDYDDDYDENLLMATMLMMITMETKRNLTLVVSGWVWATITSGHNLAGT